MIKASVQYNDLKGKVAADISDFKNNDLNVILKSFGGDINKYNAIGIEMYFGESGAPNISVSFICKDRQTSGNPIRIQKDNITYDDFFNLFKRMNLVLMDSSYKDCPLDNIDEDSTIYLD